MNDVVQRAGIMNVLARDILREPGLDLSVHVCFECGKSECIAHDSVCVI